MNALSHFFSAPTHGMHRLFIGLLIITTLCVWVLGSPHFRFQTPPDALQITQLSNDAQQWFIKGEPEGVYISEDGITLSLDEPSKLQLHTKKFFDWDADVATGATHFLVTGKLERLSERTGTMAPKKRPVFSIRLRDDGKRNGKGILVRARGNVKVEKFTELIVPDAGSDQLDIYWRLFLPGQWRFSDIEIRSVRTSTRYYVAMVGALVPLAIGFLLLATRIYRQLKPVQMLLLSGVVSVTIVSIGLAESTMKYLRDAILAKLPFDSLAGWWMAHVYEVQKSGHVLVFMVLTIVAFWAGKHLRATNLQLISGLIMLALLTEALQRHSVGRTPRMGDVWLDLVGVVVGCAICWVYFRAREYVQTNPKQAR